MKMKATCDLILSRGEGPTERDTRRLMATLRSERQQHSETTPLDVSAANGLRPTYLLSRPRWGDCECLIEILREMTLQTCYSGVIPMLTSHLSTKRGHSVIGIFVRRSPNPWPPCAYKCISTRTPAFFSAE